MEALAPELAILKQISAGGVIFKPMEPPLSKKRKREEVDSTKDESSSKRSKSSTDGDASTDIIASDSLSDPAIDTSFDPVSDVLDVCDFGESSKTSMPKSSLVPIARPEATLNFNAFIVKASSSDAASGTSAVPTKMKKTVVQKTTEKKKKGASQPTKKDGGKSKDGEDPEVDGIIKQVLAKPCKGPQKKACFYERQGLEYSSCEEDEETPEEDETQSSVPSLLDDMYAMDASLMPVRAPVVKMVKQKKTKRFTHDDYVKMDAECVFCHDVKVNRTFDQQVSIASMTLMDTDVKAAKAAKKAHIIYKRAYNSLTADEIELYNVPMMTSRHMIRHIDDHLTSLDVTNRRLADRYEDSIEELRRYHIVHTDNGPMPNVKVHEAEVKLGKEIARLRAQLHTRRLTHLSKAK